MIVLLLASLGLFADGVIEFAQASAQRRVIVRERTIIRVPRAPQEHVQQRWRETRAPRCLPADTLAGASISGPETIDLVLAGNRRVRARLERRCPAMDYYSGFYIRPGSDGMICADRDVIRARSGDSCEIASFRGLVPDRRR